MLKNPCRKLIHRAATIGAVRVSSAGKAGLLMCSSRARALLSLTAAPVSIHCGSEGKETVFVYDGAANIIYWHSCCVEISISVYHYHFPVSVVDEDAQRRFITNGSEDHLPEVSKDAFGARTKCRRHMFPGKSFRTRSPVRGRFGFASARFSLCSVGTGLCFGEDCMKAACCF